MGDLLLFPRSGPQASRTSTKNKPDKPELAHIQNTHNWEHCIFTKKGPHLIWDIWAIFAILHVGHFRLTSILFGPEEGQRCCIVALSGPLLYTIWAARCLLSGCQPTINATVCQSVNVLQFQHSNTCHCVSLWHSVVTCIFTRGVKYPTLTVSLTTSTSVFLYTIWIHAFS